MGRGWTREEGGVGRNSSQAVGTEGRIGKRWREKQERGGPSKALDTKISLSHEKGNFVRKRKHPSEADGAKAQIPLHMWPM